MKQEDLDAILSNDEAMKKIAAKVLDLTQKRPQETIICKGYYCDMADDLSAKQKDYWLKQLKTNEITLDEAVVSSVVKEIPLSEEEIQQTVIELKTSAKKTLKEAEVVAAAKKVLVDNVIMARKGGTSLDASKLICTSCGPNSSSLHGLCVPCSPNQGQAGSPIFCTICGPSDASNYSCSICGPNNVMNFGCSPCGPNNQGSPGSPFVSCVPCAPNRPATPTTPYELCTICGPGNTGFHQLCTTCGPNNFSHYTNQCSAAFGFHGCVAAFDPIPDWRRDRELVEQVSSLQKQLTALQERLARM